MPVFAPASWRLQLYHHAILGENAAPGAVFAAIPRLQPTAVPPLLLLAPDEVPLAAVAVLPALDAVLLAFDEAVLLALDDEVPLVLALLLPPLPPLVEL